MIITRKPLFVGEVPEKLPSKITCKICVEKIQEEHCGGHFSILKNRPSGFSHLEKFGGKMWWYLQLQLQPHDGVVTTVVQMRITAMILVPLPKPGITMFNHWVISQLASFQYDFTDSLKRERGLKKTELVNTNQAQTLEETSIYIFQHEPPHNFHEMFKFLNAVNTNRLTWPKCAHLLKPLSH